MIYCKRDSSCHVYSISFMIYVYSISFMSEGGEVDVVDPGCSEKIQL